MQLIFSGEIYDVIPQSNGIVFSYCKEALEDQVRVAYKMLSLDTGAVNDVAKNIYMLSKFGSNYRFAVAQSENYITAKSIVLPSGKVFVCSESGEAVIVDGEGVQVWTGDLIYRDHAPSDIAVYKNTIWACYSELGVLLRYNMTTMREELRIGGANTPFDSPQNLFVDGDTAYVCNPHSQKIVAVDLNNYTVEEYKTFEEPAFAFLKLKNYEFVLLKSGLYVY